MAEQWAKWYTAHQCLAYLGAHKKVKFLYIPSNPLVFAFMLPRIVWWSGLKDAIIKSDDGWRLPLKYLSETLARNIKAHWKSKDTLY